MNYLIRLILVCKKISADIYIDRSFRVHFVKNINHVEIKIKPSGTQSFKLILLIDPLTMKTHKSILEPISDPQYTYKTHFSSGTQAFQLLESDTCSYLLVLATDNTPLQDTFVIFPTTSFGFIKMYWTVLKLILFKIDIAVSFYK